MFYVDADGKRQDQDLHEVILGRDEIDLVTIREKMIAAGWSRDDVDRMWPLPKTAAAD